MSSSERESGLGWSLTLGQARAVVDHGRLTRRTPTGCAEAAKPAGLFVQFVECQGDLVQLLLDPRDPSIPETLYLVLAVLSMVELTIDVLLAST